jgi:hypothetical protein
MPVTWSIEPAKRLVTIRYDDPYTPAEWRDAFLAAIRDAWYEPGFGFLIDRRFAPEPTPEFARAVADFVTGRLENTRVAIVASTTAGFGMGRLQEALNAMAGLTSRAFTSVDSAVAWLQEDKHDT